MRWLVFVTMLMQLPASMAADYAVVVAQNSVISTMELGKIRDVFLKRRSFEAGLKLIPVNPLGSEPARLQFESIVLGMERIEIDRFWTTSHFQGVSPPTTQASLTSIKAFVERVEGAIGYVPIGMVDESVRVLYEF